MKAAIVLVFLLCLMASGEGARKKSLTLNNERKLTIREASNGKRQGKAVKIKKLRKKQRKANKGKLLKKKDSKAKKIKQQKSEKNEGQVKTLSEKKNEPRQSCESGVTAECMEAAKDVLFFEAYQRNNFLKQYARYYKQIETADNKFSKVGIFFNPIRQLGDAGGGNISDLVCGNNDTQSYLNGNYSLLSSCNATIIEKCNVTGASPEELTAITECNEEMVKTKEITEVCRGFPTNATAQCSCWINAKRDHVDVIKSIRPKCTGMQKIGAALRTQKNACVKEFGRCKKAEDTCVRLIAECMNFDVQDLDQAQIAKEAGADVIG